MMMRWRRHQQQLLSLLQLPLLLLLVLLLSSSRVVVSFTTTLPHTSTRTTRHLYAEAPAIVIDTVTCTHDGGDTYQLQDVSYNLPRGQKVALLGRNGAGKSTLLRILAECTCHDDDNGDDDDRDRWNTSDMGMTYTGTITALPSVRVSYVEQEPPLYAQVTVADALLGIHHRSSDPDIASFSVPADSSSSHNNNMKRRRRPSVYAVVRRYKRAAEQADHDPSTFASASADMDAMDGWSVLTKAEEVATQLRVQHLQDRLLSQLSGGERKRVALAAALVQEPDVLLLDEPTNYLSLAGVQWLADLLRDQTKLTLLMVTHDRAFLNDVCDRILELDRGQLYEYTGSYTDFLQAKEDRLALEDAAVQTAKAKYKGELEWMRRQPQARQTKSKSRIEAFYKLQQSTKPRLPEMQLSLASTDRRLGGKIMSLKHVSLKFGDTVILNDFSYEFCMGDRICIAGGNGVGKTSFVRVLTGEQMPDGGIVEAGETIKLGVYDQMGIKIEKPDQTVMEFVLEQVQTNDQFSATDASVDTRRLLNQFEFPRQRWNQRISVLSGGERRRLQLLTVITKNPNFLVLDECTSDLDHQTVMAVESYLQEFKGVLLIISHDRFFADKVSDHLFIFEGGGSVLDYPGTLSEYAGTLIEQENDKIMGQPAGSPVVIMEESKKEALYKDDKAKRNEQRNNIKQLKREMESLEKSMEKLKQAATLKQNEMDDSSTAGWSVLAALTDELNTINDRLDEEEMKWMEFAEQLEETDAMQV